MEIKNETGPADLKRELCEFMVAAWYNNRGATFLSIVAQLKVHRQQDFRIEEVLGLNFINLYADIFSVIAIHYPKVSDLLLRHRKPDAATLEKLVTLLYVSKPRRMPNDKKLAEIQNSCRYAVREANRLNYSEKVYVECGRRGNGHHWQVVK